MKTLSDLANEVLSGRPFEVELGDFLDEFYREPHSATLERRPPVLAADRADGPMLDAFLAAVAEHLCRRFGLPIPAWVYGPERYLEKPFFAMNAASFRATLLLESPMEFRSRNLFVTANALSRASEHATRG